MRVVRAQAPSNIALVKYMGKVDSDRNLPANASLSMTLSTLRTVTELREIGGPLGAKNELRWDPADPMPDGLTGHLFTPDLARLQLHLERVRERAPALMSRYEVKLREPSSLIGLRTANSFPASSGIASSASGFAAFTVAAAALFTQEPSQLKAALAGSPDLRAEFAEISREGSGSSCRSFEGPFVLWEGERARRIPSEGLPELVHFVLVVSSLPKAVPSSEAHRRIQSSPLWRGRPERANERALSMRAAIGRGNLREVSLLAWREAWEMHSLFHTSEPSFTYWEPDSVRALKFLAPYIEEQNGPIVTLDAGPNVHVLVRAQDRGVWRKRLVEALPNARLIEDTPGRGASLELV